jgi:hypothetical protein
MLMMLKQHVNVVTSMAPKITANTTTSLMPEFRVTFSANLVSSVEYKTPMRILVTMEK